MPKARNFSPWAYWMLRLDALPDGAPPPKDEEGLAAWRERSRLRLIELLGPRPSSVPLDFEVRASTDCGTYTRQSVVFDTEAGMSVPAFLLVPNDRTEP